MNEVVELIDIIVKALADEPGEVLVTKKSIAIKSGIS
jgi:predicted RNA-binding protein YlqC (UPF0109 family)